MQRAVDGRRDPREFLRSETLRKGLAVTILALRPTMG